MKALFVAMLVSGLMFAQSVVAGEPTASAQPAGAASVGQGTAKVVPCDDKAPGAKPCPKQATPAATSSTKTPAAAPAK